ncbi:hypothetical protein [Haloferula sp. A504]|uniref:hypothetical protein n=1 Tax=Haloferula sp. A504 TaxID=3373601 RepID=UPI0031CAB90E|nr:hypothetical protein [Verrucomicrobiaceae bacterium E54]
MRKAFILWLLLAVSAFGSHTMAWKVPLDHVVTNGTANPACQRLEGAPAKSDFFAAGDEIWNIAGAIEIEDDTNGHFDPFAPPAPRKEQVVDADWLVWNARSRKLVGRGSWSQLERITRLIDLESLPKLVKVGVEIHDGSDEPRKVSILTRSGVSWSLRDHSIDIQGTAHFPKPDGLSGNRPAYLEMTAAWTRGEAWTESVVLACTSLPCGSPRSLAIWEDKEGRWEVRAGANVIALDGTPVTRLRQLETPAGLRWIDDDSTERPPRMPLVGDLFAQTFPLPGILIDRMDWDETDLPDLDYEKDATVFPGSRWLDVRESLALLGLPSVEVAGFQPDQYILRIVDSEQSLDFIEEILKTDRTPSTVAELSFQSSSWNSKLQCPSGRQVSIFRSRNGKSRELLRVSPSIGSSDRIMDVSYMLNLENGLQLDSAITISSGQTHEIASQAQAGESLPIQLTGTIKAVTR